MPTYMIQGCYTSASVAAMIKSPQDRSTAVRALVESLGGKMEGFWMSFGEYDFVGIMQMPDSQAAVALSMAVGAAGSVQSFRTVELLSWADGVKAFKKAGSAKYNPPTKPAK